MAEQTVCVNECGFHVDDDGQLALNLQTWPYTCPIGAHGSGIYCDPVSKEIRGEPRDNYGVSTVNFADTGNYNISNSNSPHCVIGTFQIDGTNWCEEAQFSGTLWTQFSIAGANNSSFTVAMAYRVDGGPWVNVGAVIEVDAVDAVNNYNEIRTAGVAVTTFPAGSVSTFDVRACLDVLVGSVNLTFFRAAVRGPYGTRND